MAKSIEKNWILVYFDCDNTYVIVQDVGNKLENSKTAKVKIGKRWYSGEIKFRGSEKECGSESNKLKLGDALTTDDEQVEPGDEPQKQKQNTNKQLDPVERDAAKLNNFRNRNLDKTITNECAFESSCFSIPVEQDKNHENDLNSSFSSNSASCISNQSSIMPESSLNKILKKLSLLDSLCLDMIEVKNSLAEINKKKKSSEKEWPTEYMFGDHNLLNYAASSKSKYITGLMEILFTPEERKNGIIVEQNATTRSRRTPLDNERVNHLKNAYNIKFRTAPDKIDETWQSMIKIANRKCYDTNDEPAHGQAN